MYGLGWFAPDAMHEAGCEWVGPWHEEPLTGKREGYSWPRLRNHLAWGDVAVDSLFNLKILQLHLNQSKTTRWAGVDIVLDICPVKALISYIFFLDFRGRPLTKPRFITELCEILTTLGCWLHQNGPPGV